MKLYYWDWDKSLKLVKQKVEEFPFHSVEYAKTQHCFTNLSEAKDCARMDLIQRIEELQSALIEIDMIKKESDVIDASIKPLIKWNH